MRILLTNDDGVHAPGLYNAAKALQGIGEVTVVAPDRDLSGVASAMTLMSVVHIHENPPIYEGVKTFSVEGTPADCVVLATEMLAKKPFDLLISGINQGSNLGLDVLLSGTLGGAFQGYFRNIPSIAISVAALSNVQYEAAASTAKCLAQLIKLNGSGMQMLLNVNLPNSPLHLVKGLERTILGPRAFMETVEQGHDGRKPHYWIKRNKSVSNTVDKGTDIWAVRNDRISITPLTLSLSNHDSSPGLNEIINDVKAQLKLNSAR